MSGSRCQRLANSSKAAVRTSLLLSDSARLFSSRQTSAAAGQPAANSRTATVRRVELPVWARFLSRDAVPATLCQRLAISCHAQTRTPKFSSDSAAVLSSRKVSARSGQLEANCSSAQVRTAGLRSDFARALSSGKVSFVSGQPEAISRTQVDRTAQLPSDLASF